jgi:hypothetical protein
MGVIMKTNVLKGIVLVVAVAASAWTGTAVLESVYDLRKFGSPYGFLDLQYAGTPNAGRQVLESWSVIAGTEAFERARAHARWELVLIGGNAVTLVSAFLLLRHPLRRVRHTPSGWHISDRCAALLDELVLPAVAAAGVGAALGIVANLIYDVVLRTARDRGPAAAVGAITVVANALSLGMFVLSAFAVFVLTGCTLYLLARNRSPRLKEFIEVVRVTRFSLLAVVAVGIGLCVPDQLRDAFRALAEESWLRVAVTEIVLAAWAFTIWYAGRFLLNVSFETQRAFGGPADPPRELWGERYWPRILGVTAFLLFALATWLAWYEVADSPEVDYPTLRNLSIVNVALGVAFWAFTRFRRAVVEQITGRYDSPRGRAYRDMPPKVQWLVKGTGIVVTVLWLIVFFAPQWIAPYIGTVALLLGASITITMVGSLVVWAGERAKVPAVSVLFGLAVLFSFGNDNHTVRRLPDAPRPPRLDISDYVKDWYQWIERKYPNQTPHPLFVVSAAGGGIRAAYWTATVLARLQDLNPAFADHTLLISGVSGGSLGSLVFANLIDTTPPGGDWRGRHASFGGRASRECPYPQHAPGKYQALAATILARDFLAPTAASMLYGDFLARLLPYSLLSDRAEALEVSWERAWDATRAEPPAGLPANQLWDGNPFARSFDALHAATAMTSDRAITAKHVPLIVLNGTIVESGARIVVSHLRHPPDFKGDVENAFDHRDAPMSMSTAALMSARFTYVSPAGTYAPGTHVVDGGYFENSGAATALQWWAKVEDWVERLNRPARRARRGNVIEPIFIYIDNGAADVLLAPAPPTAPQPRRTEVRERTPRLLPELGAPVNALLAARNAHALEAKTRAQQEFVEFVTLDMSAPPAAVASSAPLPDERLNRAPLGWVLSRSAQHILDRALCRNGERMAEIVDWLPKSTGR